MHPSHKLLLFLLLGSVGQNALGAKIIDGSMVPDNSMLYMVSVQKDKEHICGGILISEDFVLTAAHCDKATSVVLGTHNLRYATDDMRYNVKKCKHPEYVNYSKGNDIMLLKLSRKAQLSNKVKIIDLPSGQESFNEHSMCTVAGWGYVKSHGSPVDELQRATVTVINENVCRRKWGNILPHSIICAGGYNTSKGFCQCDSGGPLVYNNIPVGVVSLNRNGNCNYPDFPNVYTKIMDFLPWINDVLNKKGC